MNIVVGIAVGAIVIALAIALGLKFFNTSVEEEEKEKGW
jgi:orotate phosphoribosyltransferase